MHPNTALFAGETQPVSLPVCDHYAGNLHFAAKALELQAQLGPVFDITLDLEDGAEIGQEGALARSFAQLIASEQNIHQRIGLRVHAPHHPAFMDDLQNTLGMCAQQLAYIMVPKVASANDVANAVEAIDRIAQAAGAMTQPQRQIPVHVLIETHGALREVFRIAAHPRVQSLSFGLMDFVSAHHGAIPSAAMRSPGQFDHPLVLRAKTEIAAACHAYGKVPSHNVTTEFKDTAVVIGDAQRARQELGYTRMWSIHPGQIKPIVKAFTPLASEVNDACEILRAAQANAWGPVAFENKLHDRASYRYFWIILQRARATGVALPDAGRVLLAENEATT
jgi:citrate lyase subunit beta / citryl-CoA lyase